MKRTRSQTKSILTPNHDPKPPIKTLISSKIPFPVKKIPKLTIKNKQPNFPLPTTPPPPPPTIAKPLSSHGELESALNHLRSADPLLSTIINTLPSPQFSTNTTPFLSLIKTLISQQISTKSASSIENRFISLFQNQSSILPDAVLALSPTHLRQIGISGPKATYIHDLSSKYANGFLSDSSIIEMDDETLYEKLTSVKGIGPWSVHMFMIFTLHRPDVLPVGDLGVRKGVQKLYGLKGLPSPSQMEVLCQKWKPYRSVGTWYMYKLVEAKEVLPNPSTILC
ncbi:alkylbase DNA glycosidase-like protein mag2 [Vicia villosa]|uniref:alkylbase DNA glycosidase-like protein mag2 n=1 Tax=Vicia villosa TaxID=3911 RepID=UPI00273CD956|nr:alkylbase DNA glycosidase-like protein mag2 [Vicia villosa]